MNAFDFIVTVALGSTLASVALSKSVPLLDGILAFGLLISLQYVLTWLSVRVKAVKKVITSEPVLLLYRGEMLRDEMKKQRITEEEINVAARENGSANLKNIHSIVLETTGTMSVIAEQDAQVASVMENVKNYPSLS